MQPVTTAQYFRNLSAFFLSSCIALFSSACTNGDSNDAIPGDRDRSLQTDCGVVSDGQVINPILESEGEEVHGISFLSANVFLLTIGNEERLVTLHGIQPTPSSLGGEALEVLIDIAQEEPSFFPPLESCFADTPWGVAQVGQIITRGGVSFSEDLLRRGYVAEVIKDGPCREDLLATCYEALREEPNLNE
jgi:hypothetical protein